MTVRTISFLILLAPWLCCAQGQDSGVDTNSSSSAAIGPGTVTNDIAVAANDAATTTNLATSTTNAVDAVTTNTPPAIAEDFRTTWQIPPPGDDKYDWVQLKSGEWLKGETKSLQADKLVFDSDELDELEFDWKDIHKLISPRMNTVLFDDGADRERVLGSLWITREKAIVDGEDTITRPRKDLFGIVPGVPREWNYWSGKVSLGLTLRSGNTEQVEYNSRISLARRTTFTRLTLDYLGNFSQTDGIESANNHRATLSADVFLSRMLFLRTPFAEYYRDPFVNLAHRATLGVGVGYDIFNRFNSPVVEWNVSAGPAYQHSWYESVQADQANNEGGGAMVLGTLFNWDLTSRVEFTLDYRGQFTVSTANSTTHHTELIWEIEVTKLLDLDVSFIWDYTADPKADADGIVPENSDYRLVLSLGVDF